ncbi:MAG: TolB family protein [Leptolyngbya sp. BL-A-14]
MATTTRIGTSFSESPVISGNGHYMAFASNNVQLTRVGGTQVFLEDLTTGNIGYVSSSSQGAPGNYSSSLDDSIAVSYDGRDVVFSSDATNLVPNDTNGETDLFMKDMKTGAITRISVDSKGNQIPANSVSTIQFHPSISADGRYVAFQSEAPLASNPNGLQSVFVRDTQTGITTIVSVNSNGISANAPSASPSISADGRFVAFESLATNLTPGATVGNYEIYVRDFLTNTTFCASVNSQEQLGNGISQYELPPDGGAYNPVISPNGQYVVFQSTYTNLVPGDTNGVSDVFMYNFQTHQTTRISIDPKGNQANGSSLIDYVKSSAISSNGRYVVFDSFANNLVSGDTNNAEDVFVRDIGAGTTTRVSVNSNGEEPVGGFLGTASYGGTISGDGSRITFISNGRNMNNMGINTDQIYLRDYGSLAASSASVADGFVPTPDQKIDYYGGKTIPNLQFENLYLGGSQSWNPTEIQEINTSLAAAMSDSHLNSVVQQYFLGQPITSNFLGWQTLPANVWPAITQDPGKPLPEVSQANLENYIRSLDQSGFFHSFNNLQSTVFNFVLPTGIGLFDTTGNSLDQTHLAGFHGSVHVQNSSGQVDTIYYTAGVYSANYYSPSYGSFSNGIPAFYQPWENVVATFYHELNEARTDPDVEDANRTGNSGYIGWSSRQGNEIGDYPLTQAYQLKNLNYAFKFVPLANGTGFVPIQLLYSDEVYGPEDPTA